MCERLDAHPPVLRKYSNAYITTLILHCYIDIACTIHVWMLFHLCIAKLILHVTAIHHCYIITLHIPYIFWMLILLCSAPGVWLTFMAEPSTECGVHQECSRQHLLVRAVVCKGQFGCSFLLICLQPSIINMTVGAYLVPTSVAHTQAAFICRQFEIIDMTVGPTLCCLVWLMHRQLWACVRCCGCREGEGRECAAFLCSPHHYYYHSCSYSYS